MTPDPSSAAAAPSPRLPAAVRGILWMLLSVAAMAAVMISARALREEMHTFELVFLRAAVGLAVILVIMGGRNDWRSLATARPGLHVGRNFVHLSGQCLIFLALVHLPLAEITALEFTIPIFTALIAAVVIREKVGPARWLGMAIGFAGVLVIVRPGIEAVHWATMVALAGTLCFGTSNVMVKVLTRTDDAGRIVFYMHLMQTAMALVPAIMVWTTPSLAALPWIVLIGVSGLVSHYGMTRALGLADVSVVMPLDFLRLPITALAAWLIWYETLSVWTAAGAAIIFAGSWWNTRREARAARAG